MSSRTSKKFDAKNKNGKGKRKERSASPPPRAPGTSSSGRPTRSQRRAKREEKERKEAPPAAENDANEEFEVVRLPPDQRPEGWDEEPEPDVEAPATQVAAVPAQAPVARNYIAEALSVKVPVTRDSAEHKHATKMGYSVRPTDRVNTNPHAALALDRTVAHLYAFGWCAENAIAHLFDEYGNDRTHYVQDLLAGSIPTPGVTVCGHAVVAADLRRRNVADGNSDATYRGEATAACLYVNVYETEAGPLTPLEISRNMDFRRAKYALVLTHRFPDAVGTLGNTGAYVRLPDDRVIFRPSLLDAPYGPHDACDWALSDGTEVWNYADKSRRELAPEMRDRQIMCAWTLLRSFGDLHVFLFTNTEAQGLQVGTQLGIPAACTYTEVELPDNRTWSGWIRNGIADLFPRSMRLTVSRALGAPKQRVLVDAAMLNIAKRHLRYAKVNDTLIRTIVLALDRHIRDGPLKKVCEAFPSLRIGENSLEDALIYGTVIAATQYAAQTERELVSSMQHEYGARLYERSITIGQAGKATSPDGHPQVLFGISLLIGTLLFGAYAAGRSRRASWFSPARPLLSAVVEEVLRPILAAAIGFAVAPLYCFADYMRGTASPGGAILHVLGSAALLALGPAAVPLNALAHGLWNSLARPGIPINPWLEYRSTFLEGPIEDVPEQTSTEFRVTMLTGDQLAIRDRCDARPLSDLPAYEPSEFVTVEAADIAAMRDAPNLPSQHYGFFITNAPHFVPGKGGQLYAAMIERRALKQTPFEALHDKLCLIAKTKRQMRPTLMETYARLNNEWRALSDHWLDALDTSFEPELRAIFADPKQCRADWEDHLTDNRAKLVGENLKREGQVPVVRYCEMNMKRNERLFKRTHDWKLDPCPRSIDAVDPAIIAYVGPYVWAAQNAYKRHHSALSFLARKHELAYVPSYPRTNGMRIYIVQGPLSDIELSYIITSSANDHSDHVVICIAGDDSAVFGCWQGRHFALEGDYSSYDQSQFGPAMDHEYAALAKFGVPDEIITVLQQANGSDRLATYKGARVCVKITHQDLRSLQDFDLSDPTNHRCTGGSDTSLGGSLVNAPVWAEIVATLPSLDAEAIAVHCTETAERYGFKLKCRVHLGDEQTHPYVGATFLKYVVMPLDVPEEMHLAPALVFGVTILPSRMLKIGLAGRDFTAIYSKVYRPDASDRAVMSTMTPAELRVAYGRLHMHDQALGIKNGFLMEPFTTFVERTLPLNYDGPRIVSDPDDAYRITSAPGEFYGIDRKCWKVNSDAYDKWCHTRYGYGTDVMRLVGACAASGPCFVEHPIFEAMARADYA